MAMRNLRVCDKPECNELFTAVCPLCDQDCCQGHFSLTSGVQIGIIVDSRPLGLTVTGICATCHTVLAPQPAMPPPAALSTLNALAKVPSLLAACECSPGVVSATCGVHGYGVAHPLPAGLPAHSLPANRFFGSDRARHVLPLDHIVEAMRAQVIEAVRAYMAARALGAQ